MSNGIKELQTAAAWQPPAILGGYARRALLAGGFFTLVTLAALLFDRHQFFSSYLVGYLFCLALSLGSLAVLMMQYLTSGKWGLVSRRVLEAAAATLPLMAVAFIPIVIGMPTLYPWDRAAARSDANIMWKHGYLNVPFFLMRAVVYFAIWIWLQYRLRRWSALLDERPAPELEEHFENVSGIGLVLYVLTLTFASIDWVESLYPHWSSTMFGFLFVAGQGLASFAFVIVICLLLARTSPLGRILAPVRFHDLGKLLLTFVMLWAYFSFSQLLILWSGDLPREITYYLARIHGAWKAFCIALALAQFAFPFAMLLSKNLKRAAGPLAAMGIWILVMRWVDLYWVIQPGFSPGHFQFHVFSLSVPLALLGFWLALFFFYLRRPPLLPAFDPLLAEAIEDAEMEMGA